MKDAKGIHQRVTQLSRSHKRALMVVADLIALPLALWSAFALRMVDWWPLATMAPFWWMYLVLPVAGVFVFARLGLYRAVVRFMGPQAITAVISGTAILSLLLWALAYLAQMPGFPRTVPINFALVALIYVGGTRLLVRYYYQWLSSYYGLGKHAVVIYGAGTTGAQLAATLVTSREFRNVAFVDDDITLHGSVIHGKRVYSPKELEALILRYKVERILLAIPKASKTRRKEIIGGLEPLPVRVLIVPGVEETASGKPLVEQLREVELEDLLGRDPVLPDVDLIRTCIHGKVVMVTGAGGSIGSELCRQIVSHEPKLLILYELGEFALYSIEQDLLEQLRRSGIDVPVRALLGSVCNVSRVREIIRHYKVQVIFHAAAYKHVPIVEHNILEGVRNNIIGTKLVAEIAAEQRVERFVLVSTDKAVRPTNVMGASKRFAELILQGLADLADTHTIFCMVRFGNVLGSSGSVVPLFRRQIDAGGPITVTHPEISRFFMTIPEAAQLVIQAGAMATGGDVFVLDMGEPVKITELARHMIHLMGLELRDDAHPDGDIEISYTGLRPGEKLYEELLIGSNVVGTTHPRIMRAQEDGLPQEALREYLRQLVEAESKADSVKARAILEQAVTGFSPNSPVADYLGAAVVAHDEPLLQ
jgi:FlaA1/EpsC-like NDP-sugar epimerase